MHLALIAATWERCQGILKHIQIPLLSPFPTFHQKTQLTEDRNHSSKDVLQVAAHLGHPYQSHPSRFPIFMVDSKEKKEKQ